MAYCTHCGEKLTENADHVCRPGEQAAARPNLRNLNPNLVLSLIRDPFAATSLSANSDFLYGVLGLAASVIGFFLSVVCHFKSLFGGIARSLSGFGFMGGMMLGGSGVRGSILFNSLLLGILSNAVLLLSVWYFGNRYGELKHNFRQLVTSLGGTQWLFGILFLLTGILSFVSFGLSSSLLFVFLLVDLVVLFVASLVVFNIQKEQMAKYSLFSVSSYLIVFMVLVKVFL